VRYLIYIVFAALGCDKKSASNEGHRETPNLARDPGESSAVADRLKSKGGERKESPTASGLTVGTSSITGAKELVMDELILGESPQWKLTAVGKPGADIHDPNAVSFLLDLEEDNWRKHGGTLHFDSDLAPKQLRYLSCHKAQRRPAGEYEAVAELEVFIDGARVPPAFEPRYSGNVWEGGTFETVGVVFWDRGRGGNALARFDSAKAIEVELCQVRIRLDDAAVSRVRELVRSTLELAPR